MREMGGSVEGDGWLSEGDGWLSEGDGWLSEGDGWLRERDGWLSEGDGWLSCGRWVPKLLSRLLATAALWVRIQTSLKENIQKEWSTHSSPPKKIHQKRRDCRGKSSLQTSSPLLPFSVFSICAETFF